MFSSVLSACVQHVSSLPLFPPLGFWGIYCPWTPVWNLMGSLLLPVLSLQAWTVPVSSWGLAECVPSLSVPQLVARELDRPSALSPELVQWIAFCCMSFFHLFCNIQEVPVSNLNFTVLVLIIHCALFTL